MIAAEERAHRSSEYMSSTVQDYSRGADSYEMSEMAAMNDDVVAEAAEA